MAQCWRSLNQSGCRDCLQSAKGSMGQCLPKAEGIILNVGCVVRYPMCSFSLVNSDNSSSSLARWRWAVGLGFVTFSLIVVSYPLDLKKGFY